MTSNDNNVNKNKIDNEFVINISDLNESIIKVDNDFESN
jgi:hypothetical protein